MLQFFHELRQRAPSSIPLFAKLCGRHARMLGNLLNGACLGHGQRHACLLYTSNLPILDERLIVQPILEVHDIFVAGHLFAELEGQFLTPRELAGYPLVMLEREANSRRYVDDWFAEQGVRLAPEIELGAHELLPSFAAIGFGLACVVQEFCQKELAEGVVFPLHLVPPVPARSIGACLSLIHI